MCFSSMAAQLVFPCVLLEHSVCLCRHGHHWWLPARVLSEPGYYLTESGSIRRLLEMRNSIQWLVNLHQAVELSDVKKNRSLLYGYKNSQSPSGKSEGSNWESACRARGMTVSRGWGKETRDTPCFREVEGLFQVWVTFIAFGAILSEPGCTLILCPWVQIVNPFFPVSVILRRNCYYMFTDHTKWKKQMCGKKGELSDHLSQMERETKSCLGQNANNVFPGIHW